jgi:hypothetical protein
LALAPRAIGVAKGFKNGVKNRFSEALFGGQNDVSVRQTRSAELGTRSEKTTATTSSADDADKKELET